MTKVEKIAVNGIVTLYVHMEGPDLKIRGVDGENSLLIYDDEIEKLYNAIGKFLKKQSSNPPSDEL